MSDMLSPRPEGRVPKNRWYDKRDITARAINLFETFPDNVQAIIAQGIITLANEEFEANELMRSYKTLGKERVLSLHKSQRKLRYLDRDHTVHKAMTYLYVLSEESQDFMAKKILEMMEFITQYVKTCQTFESEPTQDDIIQVADTYIKEGVEGTEVFLKKMKSFLSLQIENRKRTPRGFSDGKVGFSNDEKGMKIRDLDPD